MRRRIISLSVITALLIQIFGCFGVFADTGATVVRENQYLPKRAFTQVFNGGLLLTWQNPEASTLSDVKIYDITGGVEKLLSDSESTDPKKIILYEIPSLTVNTVYQYRVDFSFTDREDIGYYFTGKTATVNEPAKTLATNKAVYYGSKRFGAWSVQIVNQTHSPTSANPTTYDRRMPLKYSLDSEIKRGDSGASMRYDNNAKDYSNSNAFIRLYALTDSTAVTLTSGKTYKVSYWAKTEDITQFRMHFNFVAFDGMTTTMPITGTTDWTRYEAYYTPTTTGSTQLRLMTDGVGTIWVDDIELHEWDKSTDSAVTGENLIQGGDFNTISKTSATVESFAMEDDFGGITLKWTNAQNCTSFNIYEPVGNTYELRGSIPSNGTSIKLPFSEGEHKYLVAPVNTYGVEGAMSEVMTAKCKVDNTKYDVKSAFSSPFSGGVLLTWKNPTSTELKSVKVYDITDGTEKLVEGEISTEASKYILFPVEGLTNGEMYQFKAVFDFGNDVTRAYYFTGKPVDIKESTGTSSNAVSFGAWSSDFYNQSLKVDKETGEETAPFEKKQPFSISLDTDVKHGDDGAAVRFDGNADSTAFNSIYVKLQGNSMTLKANTPYKLTYWTKTDSLKEYLIHMSWAKFSEDKLNTSGPAKGTTDWTKRELVHITGNSNETKQLILVFKYIGTIWVDDFEMYEAEEVIVDGVKTYEKKADAENLIKNGDFENIAINEGTVSDLKAEDGEREITLTWDKVTGGSDEMNLYEEIDGEYHSIGKVLAKSGKITLSGLSTGEHKYKLVPVNAQGMEGVPSEISAESVLPEYEILVPEFTKISGKDTIRVPVKNYKKTDGMNVEVLVAVCVGNAMRKLYTNKAVIAKSSEKAPMQYVDVTLDIESTDTKLEVYVFDSRNDMNILYPGTVYTLE